jgi:hypothetical protein
MERGGYEAWFRDSNRVLPSCWNEGAALFLIGLSALAFLYPVGS